MFRNLCFVIALTTLPVSAQTPEKSAVLATVQAFFDSMQNKDAAVAGRVLIRDGQFHSIREQDGRPQIRTQTHQQFLDGLAAMPAVLERMWDPTVLIEGPLAVVWTSYDFHREGEFSHCGVDAFTLLKTPAGWKITGASYTVIRDNCTESPLGPPGGNAP